MLSKRLQKCLFYVEGYRVLYDIGTDHALLPIAAIKSGIIDKAYAVDNKLGPLNQAKENIAYHALNHQIFTLHTSGIDALEEDATVCVMAGLGGHQILETFAPQNTKNLQRFIFQPSTNPESVRKLTELGFRIINEEIFEDAQQIYFIIIMEKGSMKLSKKEIQFGPFLLKMKPIIYQELLEKEMAYLEKLIRKIPDDIAKEKQIIRLNAIKEVLHEWNNH